MTVIERNLKEIFSEISRGNDLGEKITLLGATKYVPVEKINEAIKAGLETIGENHAQEFRDKLPFYAPCEKHFIGSLQKNKLKYIVGKADVIDSVSSSVISYFINEKAASLGVIQKVMLEINAGEEQSKTGVSIKAAKSLYKSIIEYNNLELVGVSVMLPKGKSEEELAMLCKRVRGFYDEIRQENENVKTLSMGMSDDYKTAIKNGSNEIRLGRAIFGERPIRTTGKT